jgi:streptomycin 6-kinase
MNNRTWDLFRRVLTCADVRAMETNRFPWQTSSHPIKKTTSQVVVIPERLATACRGSAERRTWLEQLPGSIRQIQDRWELSLERPLAGSDVSCSWVAPVVRRDRTRAVLKVGMPHMEGAHELQGLHFWDGDPTVRLLDADAALNAMLLEYCEPGIALRRLPQPEQDVVIARLFQRLWRRPAAPHPFRPLAAMTSYWAEETRAAAARWPDALLVEEGLRLFDELSRPSSDDVLLATDLHAGNVLSSQREPWLVIDPKPFIGDRAYDATQHLFNCRNRIVADPVATIRRFADLLELDDERVRLWMFARSASEPRDTWSRDSLRLARALT